MADSESKSASAGSIVRVSFNYPDVETFARKTVRMITRGGIFLPTREMRPEGSTVRFECVIDDGTPVIRGEGKVLWARQADPDKPQRAPGLGLQFTKLDKKGRAVVTLVLKLAEVEAMAASSPEESPESGEDTPEEGADPTTKSEPATESEPAAKAEPEPAAKAEPEPPPESTDGTPKDDGGPKRKKPSLPPPVPADAKKRAAAPPREEPKVARAAPSPGLDGPDTGALIQQQGPLKLASGLPRRALARLTKKGEAEAALNEVLGMRPVPDDEPAPVEPPPLPPRRPAQPPPIPEAARNPPPHADDTIADATIADDTIPSAEVPIFIDGAGEGEPSIPFSLDAPDDWQRKG